MRQGLFSTAPKSSLSPNPVGNFSDRGTVARGAFDMVWFSGAAKKFARYPMSAA